MGKRAARRVVATITAMAVMAMPVVADANPLEPEQPTTSLGMNEARPGELVNGRGTGFEPLPPARDVEVRWGSEDGQVLTTTRPAIDRTIKYSFRVPDVAPGEHQVVVSQWCLLADPFNPTAIAKPSPLPGMPVMATLRVLPGADAARPAPASRRTANRPTAGQSAATGVVGERGQGSPSSVSGGQAESLGVVASPSWGGGPWGKRIPAVGRGVRSPVAAGAEVDRSPGPERSPAVPSTSAHERTEEAQGQRPGWPVAVAVLIGVVAAAAGHRYIARRRRPPGTSLGPGAVGPGGPSGGATSTEAPGELLEGQPGALEAELAALVSGEDQRVEVPVGSR